MAEFRGITLILLNAKLTKEGGVFRLTLRTEKAKRIIERYALANNLHIEISVDPPPRFYATKADYLESLRKHNDIFRQLEEGLGLKLIE